MLGVSKEASWIRRYRDRIDMVKLICLKPGNGRLSCSVESYMVEFMELCGVTEKGGDEDDSISGNGGPPRSGAMPTSETCLQHFVAIGKSAKLPRALK
ncbi:hypothetical protein F2Q68_00025845 [Brassica cretica]|uniref:Uncharacterized protein n=2 Tax=Brassica cretica TaxID=69181 RepID=A0A8S9I7U9_BRACR|nr:hypothetical protein F2Q68_00025845 [Brassica cretica]KAF3575597.1 hypothetical protein DY000_02031811 [Brassica cretica]